MIGRSIYVRIAGTALIGIFLFVEAHGAGSIYYGSRAGMEVTVVGVSGIGTTHAVIRVKHTRENARTFCTDYANDKSEACVDRTLRETRLNDQLEGNCETGWFTSLYGERLRFIGEAKHKGEFDPKYIILSDGKPLDGSSASGYSYDLEQLSPASRRCARTPERLPPRRRSALSAGLFQDSSAAAAIPACHATANIFLAIGDRTRRSRGRKLRNDHETKRN
jgi:hypothetical protein